MRNVGPWVVCEDGCGAYRALQGTNGEVIANRVAFIEKTPRVRIRPEMFHPESDWLNWAQGPFKGDGPEDAESRQWCDDMLRLLGYTLEADATGQPASLVA